MYSFGSWLSREITIEHNRCYIKMTFSADNIRKTNVRPVNLLERAYDSFSACNALSITNRVPRGSATRVRDILPLVTSFTEREVTHITSFEDAVYSCKVLLPAVTVLWDVDGGIRLDIE